MWQIHTIMPANQIQPGCYVWYRLLLRMLGLITPALVVIPQGLLHVFQNWVYKWEHVLVSQRGTPKLKMQCFSNKQGLLSDISLTGCKAVWATFGPQFYSYQFWDSTTCWFAQTTLWWSASNIRAVWFSESQIPGSDQHLDTFLCMCKNMVKASSKMV